MQQRLVCGLISTTEFRLENKPAISYFNHYNLQRSTDTEENLKKKIIEALKNGYKPLSKQN